MIVSKVVLLWKTIVRENMNKFAIIHMQKFQISDLQGIQKHNQRQGKSKSNLDIDYSKSEQNYDLLNQQKLDMKAQLNKRSVSE